MKVLRPIIIFLGLIAAWEALVLATGVEHFILPGPGRVARALVERWPELIGHAGITGAEIVLGLALGTLLGCASALLIASFRPGATLAAAGPGGQPGHPGLRPGAGAGALARLRLGVQGRHGHADHLFSRSPPRSSTACAGPSRAGWTWRAPWAAAGSAPCATSAFRPPCRRSAPASGWPPRSAPIGAIVGEWVGSSAGLGYLMLQANARMQIDVMFAALFVLAVFAVGLYTGVDFALRRALPWQAEDAGTAR